MLDQIQLELQQPLQQARTQAALPQNPQAQRLLEVSKVPLRFSLRDITHAQPPISANGQQIRQITIDGKVYTDARGWTGAWTAVVVRLSQLGRTFQSGPQPVVRGQNVVIIEPPSLPVAVAAAQISTTVSQPRALAGPAGATGPQGATGPAGPAGPPGIDASNGLAITAANVVNTPAGAISSTDVQNALNELDQVKAPLANPTFTGTVGGITATMVGLGNVTNESKATMFSSPTFTGNAVFNSYASIKSLIETATVTASSPSSIQAFDTITQGVQYYTANSANAFTINVRGNSSTTLNSILSVGQSISIGLLITCSDAAHYMTSVDIDGTATGVTTVWQGGVTPTTGNTSSIDVYTLTIVKTAVTPTYTVLATQTRFA